MERLIANLILMVIQNVVDFNFGRYTLSWSELLRFMGLCEGNLPFYSGQFTIPSLGLIQHFPTKPLFISSTSLIDELMMRKIIHLAFYRRDD